MNSKYLFMASMNIESDKQQVFDEVYDTEHVPFLAEVPGVISIARFKTEELRLAIGGDIKNIVVDNQPKHTAIYEVESPEVLISREWSDAVEKGRWANEVRPYTKNRKHILLRRN
ncbi:MAG: hypothetical protein CL904_00435 [Dehalococcoidia bacterium]|nr:hypothetical protein [Dehalococcoidia bacterium]MQG16397.1 hypothetical protein [SAR202 cluster bacterium]|tara:strand:+ start:161 stop:505 length:345 start_codon:yes stop_codon:yes gene_type:complete